MSIQEELDDFQEAFEDEEQAAEDAAESLKSDDVAEIEPLEAEDVEDITESQSDYEPEKNDWEHKFKSNAGRISAYQAQLAEIQAENERLKQAQLDAQQQAQQSTDQSDAWGSLKETDPELATAIEARFGSVDEVHNLRQEINAEKQRQAAFEQAQHREREAARLAEKHPDFMEIANSQEFLSWIDEAPAHIQQMRNTSQSATDASWILDQYKARFSRNETQTSNVSNIKQRRKEALQNSSTQVSGSNVTPAANAPDDFDNAFDFFAKQEEKKRA